MEKEDRLDRLEVGLRKIQDSYLIMSKDLHSMNESVKSIAHSLETLVVVQQDMKVMSEREENRHNQLKEADKVIHKRIDDLAEKRKEIETKADNGNRAYKILVQIAKWFGVAIVTLFVGLMVFLIQLKG